MARKKAAAVQPKKKRAVKVIPFYVIFDGKPRDSKPGLPTYSFVGTETKDGKSVGPRTSGKWNTHPLHSNQARLGPLVRATPLVLLAPQLLDALRKAQQHLEYCGYGDKWERECATSDKLPELIEAAIKAAGSKPL